MRSRLEATYALLEANETGHTVQLCYVPYDYEAVITQLHAVKHPAAAFLARFMHGEIVVKQSLTVSGCGMLRVRSCLQTGRPGR